MIHLKQDAVHKLLLKTILLIVFLLCTACSNDYSDHYIEIKEDGLIYKVGRDDPYTGRIVDTVENKIVEYDVVKGVKNGEFVISTLEGIVTIMGNLQDNMNIGEWNYFYSNGQLESKGNFNNDLPEGKWMWYHPNGKIKETGTFLEGVKIGRWYQYNNDGNLVLIIYYDFGEIIEEVHIEIMRST